MSSNNATLLQKVASGAYPDVYIANWRDYSAPVRSWFVPDGIHYQPVGALGVGRLPLALDHLPVLRAVPEADDSGRHRSPTRARRRTAVPRPMSPPSTADRPGLIERSVVLARRAGFQWAPISRLLGISCQ